MEIASDALAYWFLRLNGFLTTVNFIVHPEFQRDTNTDVDILAVRFPYRRENLCRPMEDSSLLPLDPGRPLLFITEVKLGLCDLNGPWTREDARNLHKVISAIGIIPLPDAEKAAVSLQATGTFDSDSVRASLACIGARHNPRVAERYPGVPQIRWRDALEFIYTRFSAYRTEKAWNGQWDRDGSNLFQFATASTLAEFRDGVRIIE